ncbi:hypothetical protein HU200_027948 [Digitaria exilis]|uniref:Disease resistance N-terminal domain-containing protein n=1 Tax=Digitaria exilis TaxID=1010633 RepID=A0A835BVH4_9POAL|nr:hypothetical protein HU200_027948 [Digitaria exilis]
MAVGCRWRQQAQRIPVAAGDEGVARSGRRRSIYGGGSEAAAWMRRGMSSRRWRPRRLAATAAVNSQGLEVAGHHFLSILSKGKGTIYAWVLMAEMVSSAVVNEAVSQIMSDLISRHEEKQKSKAKESLERLEMAHIKLDAALGTSEKWQITDASLLRWRKKLKRAAQECDDTLQKCKHRIIEDEQIEQEVRNSAFPKRIAHATKSFISSAFGHNNQLSRSVVRRFEWYADGACDFLRFIELGCTPHCHMSFNLNSFIRNLFAGKELQYKIDQGNESTFFVLWLPFSKAEHGIEVTLFFIQKDVSLDGGEICLQDSQYLIAGLLFMPHGSSEDLLPVNKSSVIAFAHDMFGLLRLFTSYVDIEHVVMLPRWNKAERDYKHCAMAFEVMTTTPQGQHFITVQVSVLRFCPRLPTTQRTQKDVQGRDAIEALLWSMK